MKIYDIKAILSLAGQQRNDLRTGDVFQVLRGSQTLLAAVLLFVFLIITPSLALPQIQEFKTPKGIHVWLVQDKTVQAITLAFSHPGGAIMPPDKAGVAGLTERMLQKGSGPYNNHQFQELLGELGVEFNAKFDADFFSGSLRTTFANRFEAFRLFKEFINHPRFEPQEFELVRQEFITYVQNAQRSPGYPLERMISQKLFPNHPYGIPMEGTPETLHNITLEDLKSYLSKHQTLTGLKVVLCGNLTVDESKAIVDELFGHWPQGEPFKGNEILQLNLDGKTEFKSFPGGQSVAQFFQKGLSPKDKDFVKLVLANMVLGGFSTSRLFTEIREERGLAYTVSTYPSSYRYVNFYTGSLGSDHKHIDQSIELVRLEWAKMRDKGISAEELSHAKSGLLGSFAFRFASTLSTALTLLEYMQDGFTPQYVADRTKRISSVTLKELNEFIKNFYTPDKLTFFVVGQKVPQVPVKSRAESTTPAAGSPEILLKDVQDHSNTRNVSEEKK